MKKNLDNKFLIYHIFFKFKKLQSIFIKLLLIKLKLKKLKLLKIIKILK